MSDKKRSWLKLLLGGIHTGVTSLTEGQRALVDDLGWMNKGLGARFDTLETKTDRVETRLDWLAVLAIRVDKLATKVDQIEALTTQVHWLATRLDGLAGLAGSRTAGDCSAREPSAAGSTSLGAAAAATHTRRHDDEPTT
jgi:hypothetical protein